MPNSPGYYWRWKARRGITNHPHHVTAAKICREHLQRYVGRRKHDLNYVPKFCFVIRCQVIGDVSARRLISKNRTSTSCTIKICYFTKTIKPWPKNRFWRITKLRLIARNNTHILLVYKVFIKVGDIVLNVRGWHGKTCGKRMELQWKITKGENAKPIIYYLQTYKLHDTIAWVKYSIRNGITALCFGHLLIVAS